MNPHGRACTEQATRRQGWRLTTREQWRLARLLHYSPTFLKTCPWTPEQGLDAEFWPEGERPPVRRMGFNA